MKLPWSMCFLLALVFGCSLAQEQQKGHQREKVGIEHLIDALGSSDADQREKAAKEILKRDDALKTLRKASLSAKPEVARQSAALLEKLLAQPGMRHLLKAREYAESGHVDLLFEHLGRLEKGQHEEQSWKLFHVLMTKVREAATRQNPDLDFAPHVFLPNLDEDHLNREILVGPVIQLDAKKKNRLIYWVRARDFSAVGAISSGSMILATGKIKMVAGRPHGLSSIFAYAGESAELPEMTASILLCDGDVTFISPSALPGDSIIIARGSVRFDCGENGGPKKCHIITGEKVKFVGKSLAEESVIVEHERRPLGFLKFFELSDLGLNLIENDHGLCVNSVEKNQPLGRSGIQSFDKILTVDGKEIRTYEAFRRYVRQKYVAEEHITLQIDRNGDRDVKIKVDWK